MSAGDDELRHSTTFEFTVEVVHDQDPVDLAGVVAARLEAAFRAEGADVWGHTSTWRSHDDERGPEAGR